MRKSIVVLGIAGIFAVALTIAGVQAQGPAPSSPSPPLPRPALGSSDTINFQGQLYDKATGGPVPPGNYSMLFTLCTDGTNRTTCAATSVWSGTFTSAVDDDGLFNVLLPGLDAGKFTGDRWLMVEVWNGANWDWMSPNQPVTGVALAIGNLRKNIPDTSAAYTGDYVLTINNINPDTGGGVYAAGRRYGLYGSAGNGGDGVRGEATGLAGWGVSGYSADGYGVYGKSDNNIGVYAYTSATGGTTYGVYAKHASTKGAAGYFWAENSSGTKAGVYGRDDSNDGFGAVGHNFWSGVGVGAWSWGGNIIEAYDGDYPSTTERRLHLTNDGNLYIDGSLFSPSSNPAGVDSPTPVLAAVMSPEVWAEDFGTGTLVKGRTIVEIDPLFAKMVNLEEEYHVFLTPLSQEAVVLFVTDKTPTGFAVQGVTLDGRPAVCSFDYRIVAKRLGYENLRMEPAPVAPSPPKEPEPPDSGRPATKP